MGRTQLGFSKARRQSKPSAAARRLIDATKSLLESHSPGEITTAMMLEEARVARNTLYLHFEDHTALLEVALLEVFVGGVKDHLKLLTDSFRKSKTKVDFLKRVSEVISISQDRQRRDFRIARCRLIAHSDRNPRFSSLLKAEQSSINKSYTAFFAELQHKGWMGNNISAETAAVLIQALTLGRVIDDVSEQKIPQASWNNAFMKITKEVILGPSSSVQ
jgi:AcrR family transcriptional regulator